LGLSPLPVGGRCVNRIGIVATLEQLLEEKPKVAPVPVSRRERCARVISKARAAGGKGRRKAKESLLRELAEELLAVLAPISKSPGVEATALWGRIIEGSSLRVAGEWEVAADSEESPKEIADQIEERAKAALANWCKRKQLSIAIAKDVAGFVERARQLEQRGYPDTALDLIYDSVDELLRRGQFALCDSILSQVNVAECSVDVLMALLTATAPASANLATRGEFLRGVERVLENRGEYEPGLLDGLER